MEIIEFEGEIYYYKNGKFYDGSFCEMAQRDSAPVFEYYLSTIDLNSLNFDDFIAFTNQLDNGGNYSKCIEIIEKGFEIFSSERDYAKIMLPKLFKMYRMLNQPQRVIDLWTVVWSKKAYSVESAPLYIVIGAAYCDLQIVADAERYANRAYGMLGGKPSEYLSNLYMRINALKQ